MGKPNEVNLLNFVRSFKNHCKNKDEVLLNASMTELEADNLMRDLESLGDMVDPDELLDWLTDNVSTFDTDDLHEFIRVFLTGLGDKLKLDELNDILSTSSDNLTTIKLYKFTELSEDVQSFVTRYIKHTEKLTIKQAREWCINNNDDYLYTRSGALIGNGD